MKKLLTIVLLLTTFHVFSQQGKPGENTVDKIKKLANKVSLAKDSLSQASTDTIKTPSLEIPDSLKRINNPLDSIKNPLNAIRNPLDSLKKPLDKVNGLKEKTALPTATGANSVQSAQEKVNGASSSVQNKSEDVQNKVTERSNDLSNKVGEKLNKLTGKETNVDPKLGDSKTNLPNVGLPDQKQLPGSNVNLPKTDVNLPKTDTNLPNANTDKSLPAVNTDLGNALKLPETKLPGEVTELGEKVKDVQEQSKEITEATGKVKEVSEQAKSLEQTKSVDELSEQGEVKDIAEKADIDLDEANKYKDQLGTIKEKGINDLDSKEIEEQAGKLSGVSEVTKQSEKLNQMQAANKAQLDMLQKYNDKKLIQQELKRKSANIANDQLKEVAPLKDKADEFSKVKRRAGSVKDYTDTIKIKRVNAMKGKPFKDRIVPGLTLQTYNGVKEVLLDVSPQVGYKITGKLTSGIGYVSRIGMGKTNPDWIANKHISGFRVYSDFTLARGIFVHGEYEALRARMFSMIDNQIVEQEVKSFNVGLGKSYSISRNLRGRLVAMYRLDFSNGIQGQSKFGIRIGFDYVFKKKRKII